MSSLHAGRPRVHSFAPPQPGPGWDGHVGPGLMGTSGELAGCKNREGSPSCLEKAHGEGRRLHKVTTAWLEATGNLKPDGYNSPQRSEQFNSDFSSA